MINLGLIILHQSHSPSLAIQMNLLKDCDHFCKAETLFLQTFDKVVQHCVEMIRFEVSAANADQTLQKLKELSVRYLIGSFHSI